MMSKFEVVFSGQLEGHKDSVYALVRGAEPNKFFSAGGDGMVVAWDLNQKGAGTLVAQLPTAVYSLLYFHEQNILLAGCRFGALYVLDLEKHRQIRQIDLKGDIFDLQYLPGRQIIAAACAGGFLAFLSWPWLETVEEKHPVAQHCRSLALNSDARWLASGWSDGKIRIYDAADMHETVSIEAHHPSVFSALYSRDGKRLISGGRDAQIRLWDAENLYEETKKIAAHLYTVNALIFIPGHNMVASASRDKSVKLWDAETFELLKVIDRTKMPFHTHSVNKILWPGYENLLVSAGDDKIIRILGIIS